MGHEATMAAACSLWLDVTTHHSWAPGAAATACGWTWRPRPGPAAQPASGWSAGSAAASPVGRDRRISKSFHFNGGRRGLSIRARVGATRDKDTRCRAMQALRSLSLRAALQPSRQRPPDLGFRLHGRFTPNAPDSDAISGGWHWVAHNQRAALGESPNRRELMCT